MIALEEAPARPLYRRASTDALRSRGHPTELAGIVRPLHTSLHECARRSKGGIGNETGQRAEGGRCGAGGAGAGRAR
eukprot:tig00000741_g3845.t1